MNVKFNYVLTNAETTETKTQLASGEGSVQRDRQKQEGETFVAANLIEKPRRVSTFRFSGINE